MLPYDAEVLFAFHAQLTAPFWPYVLAGPLLGLAALGMALRPVAGRNSGRGVLLLLALGWAWVGWLFFLQGFARFDFLAPLYGWAFLLQALLLAANALVGRPAFGARARFAGVGAALALLALFAWPLAGPLYGGGWPAAPLAGIMPGPTALLTLGLLLTAEGRGRLHLALLPLAWCGVAGFRGWALGLPPELALAALGLAALGLLAWKRLRPQP